MRRASPIRAIVIGCTVILFTCAQAPVASGAGNDLVGQPGMVETRYEDILYDVARTHDVGMLDILAANPGLNPWLPGEGTSVLLPTSYLLPAAPRKGIVVNVGELRLYYFKDWTLAMTFPIGVAREGFSAPRGTSTVIRKTRNPIWYPTESHRRDDPTLPAAVPPGPKNPLGSHALYLGWPAYLIHGTNKPDGIGQRVSRGCIRLYPEDIARLYQAVPVGTPVTIIEQPVKLGWHEGELYIEAHPDSAQLDELALHYAFTRKSGELYRPQIETAAGARGGDVDWEAAMAALEERRGIPVRITRSSKEPVGILQAPVRPM